jgi:cell division transport system permease protein
MMDFKVIKTGFVNFWRNLWLSVAATMVMTITLVIFAVLFLMFALTSYSVNTIKDTVDISVYFKAGASETQTNQITQNMQTDARVRSVNFVSADQALQDFKNAHSQDPAIAASLNELTDNPLPATLHVKAKNLGDYPSIVSTLQGDQYKAAIASVNYQNDPKIQVAIDRLDKILRFTLIGGFALIVIFSLIAILVIFNTITLTIFNRKEEVEIMRLVGATNWYIRGPFLVESALYTFFAVIITGALLIPIFTYVIPQLARYINPSLTLFNRNIFNFWYIIIMLTIVSLALSVGSTTLALRKYLRI